MESTEQQQAGKSVPACMLSMRSCYVSSRGKSSVLCVCILIPCCCCLLWLLQEVLEAVDRANRAIREVDRYCVYLR
jgi:hypothetical protein